MEEVCLLFPFNFMKEIFKSKKASIAVFGMITGFVSFAITLGVMFFSPSLALTVGGLAQNFIVFLTTVILAHLGSQGAVDFRKEGKGSSIDKGER